MIEFKNIIKTFQDVDKPILNGINLKLNESRIFAVIGNNGEGKSTFANIMAGVFEFDCGEVFINGLKQKNWNVDKAKKYGVYLVPQIPFLDLNLKVWEYLSVYWFDNCFFFPINKSKVYKYYRWLRQFYNISFNFEASIKTLNIKEAYFLMIISALKANAKIIIFDESTAYFSEKESIEFVKFLGKLKKAGIISIFITHGEIGNIAKYTDEFIILKDGKCFRTSDKEKILDKLEVRSNKNFSIITNLNDSKEVIVKFNLFFEDFWKYDVSFSLKKRGVFGIITEEAAVRTWEKIFLGELPFVGSVKIAQKMFEYIDIYKLKIGFLPLGINNLFPDNISIINSFLIKMMSFNGRFFINRDLKNQVKDFFLKNVESLTEKNVNKVLNSKSCFFSGGNLKKFALFREKLIAQNFLVCFSPLSNLDYRSYTEVSVFIRNFAKEKPVILITSSLDEVFLLSDEILAIKSGNILLNEKKENIDKKKLKELLFI